MRRLARKLLDRLARLARRRRPIYSQLCLHCEYEAEMGVGEAYANCECIHCGSGRLVVRRDGRTVDHIERSAGPAGSAPAEVERGPVVWLAPDDPRLQRCARLVPDLPPALHERARARVSDERLLGWVVPLRGELWIDLYPVTEAQWRARTGKPDGSADRPAVGIDWYEALAHARYEQAELPAEALWLLAAEGADPRFRLRRPRRVGPGLRGRSTCGAIGMTALVWHWCACDLSAEMGFEARPLRGGSWRSLEAGVEARRIVRPDQRFPDVGLRLLHRRP